MKIIKIYFVVASILLCLALGFGVYVWYKIQTLNQAVDAVTERMPVTEVPTQQPSENIPEVPTQQPSENIPEATSSQPKNVVQQPVPSTPVIEKKEEPILIQTATLSESQQKIIKGLGYTGDTITISPVMVRCAEDSVGKARLAEILAGATPGALEAISLMSCFNK